jgi:hypothetical protein
VSEPPRPALYDWFAPSGWPHPPPSLEAAEAAFAGAKAAYARGDADAAAAGFAEAARLVPEATGERYAAALAAMREVALRNAVLAGSQTG